MILIHLENTIETGENIPLTPVGGGSTWEPECEQEASFGGGSHRTKLVKDYVRDLYQKLPESRGETLETFHYDYFRIEDGELYYRGKRKPLMTKGVLKLIGMLADILGKGGLCSLGFDIPRGKLTAQQAVMLNKTQEELPSESDITKVDDIGLQEIVENVSRSIENLNQQVQEEPTEDLPMQELLGLDKQLRSI